MSVVAVSVPVFGVASPASLMNSVSAARAREYDELAGDRLRVAEIQRRIRRDVDGVAARAGVHGRDAPPSVLWTLNVSLPDPSVTPTVSKPE